MKRRNRMSILLAGVMTLSMAAAAGTVQAAQGSATGDNVISVAAWDASFNIPALQAAADDYNANVNADVQIAIIEQAGSSDIENAITLAASSGDYSQLPDIVLFQDHWIQKYVADYPDAFIPLDDIDIDWDDFGAEKLSYSTIDGVHYGVPVDNGTVIFAYRVDVLEEAGYTIDDLTGISWDEWLEIGKVVQEKTGKYLLSMDGSGNDLPYMMMQAEGASQFKDGAPYLAQNEDMIKVITVLKDAVEANVLYLANSWSDYTDQTIIGDMVAGVMNGNWIIPTMEQVAENSGKWEITTMPTLDGGKEGYAANGGSSLYITGNCQNVELAKDFLAKTFGGSTVTYDRALTDGGVITCCISAGESEVYNEGVEFFNEQPIYATIVQMGANVIPVEQNDFHYTARQYVGSAIQNILTGQDVESALQDAEDQLNFAMGN